MANSSAISRPRDLREAWGNFLESLRILLIELGRLARDDEEFVDIRFVFSTWFVRFARSILRAEMTGGRHAMTEP